jgi:hypothetical protein
MAAEPRLSQMPELRADQGVRIARGVCNLLQRTPTAVEHQTEHPPDLPSESIVVNGGIVDNAIEPRCCFK